MHQVFVIYCVDQVLIIQLQLQVVPGQGHMGLPCWPHAHKQEPSDVVKLKKRVRGQWRVI